MTGKQPTEEINAALAAAVGRPRTVLDVGAGGGAGGMAARAASASVTAIEKDPVLAERARRLLGEVIQVDPSDLAGVAEALGERRFDLVMMPGVLEQTASAEELVKGYAGYLESEGRLIVSLGNREGSPVRLGIDTLQAAGLELLQIDNHPMLLKAARGFAVVIARRPPEPRPLSLTVGMLTMDEEPSIARMVGEIRRHAPDAEILCVDSSVKDQTPAIAEKLGASVLRQLPPRGHGPAMELLMYEAAKQSDALIYLDCDFTYPPSVIPAIRQILEAGVDVVNAARTRQRPEAMPLANYLANKAFALCAQALNGVKVADLHSGMRGYRSSLIRAFAFDGQGDALPIDTLLWPARCGYHVVEVPIDYQERVGVSKLRKLAGTVWTLIRLGKTLGVGSRGQGTYEVRDGFED